MSDPGMSGWQMMVSAERRKTLSKEKRPGRRTALRIMRYARPYGWEITIFLLTVAVSAAIGVATPVLAGRVINVITAKGAVSTVIWLAALIAGLAVFDAGLSVVQRWHSARIGEGIILDLRRTVFDHVQRMPIAFFTRTQTGALVSRLNNDVIGAQRAFTSVLSGVVSNVIALALTVGTMLTLSWQITAAALVLLPVFVLPARWVGRKLADITRQTARLNASMNSTMTERFNVSGALLVKLFGRPTAEAKEFGDTAAQVRDMGVKSAMYSRGLFVALGLLTAVASAATYGLGGWLALTNALSAGTVVTLALLLTRLYGPITALSNVQVDVMSALVSFERVFEVVDLPPMITDRPDAKTLPALLPADQPAIVFDDVRFRYPSADEVSLASLEDLAVADRRAAGDVLHGVSFTAEPGQLIALVGPSGAGKTTISQLVSRIYDVTGGAVKVAGTDVRDWTQESLRGAIGVVTQDAHLFHDTIKVNLVYAKPDATEDELWSALDRAQVGELVRSLPDGLDTVVGDRGYRLSGGEKQRLAIARLLLKGPSIVVLDEATARTLDSESEAAVQRARSTRRWPGVRRWSSRTGCPPSGPPTRSWCWSMARSWSAARMSRWSQPTGSTPSCITRSSPIRPYEPPADLRELDVSVDDTPGGRLPKRQVRAGH
nr:ABC transporter ATP-binding protein [Fodinicola feengrottensis]